MALTACGLAEPARRAYEWLAATQRADGSWPKKTSGGVVTDAAAESNQVAYVAVGVWHELLVTGDEQFAAAMWPVVRRAIGFVLDLQRAARRDRLGADGATEPPRGTRCWPAAPASTRACAARPPWPSTWASRSRTGSSPPTSSGT